MAKRGAVQQLQAEISTDEEFEKFIERYSNALIVLDVYSEWCGPCLGAVNALRKIKLEIGGDKLQLAICKCDHLTKLKRFWKKSEPTWLFIREGKSVNIIFGTDIPLLMHTIMEELHAVDIPISKRNFISIEEMHPEEKKREKIKKEAKESSEFKDRHERESKRKDYLTFCTNAILENLPDLGVSIFGTHVTREMFKQINEPAEALKMQCKDKRYQCITKEEFETANFACDNPLPADVMEQMAENNVLMCFWKVTDDGSHNVPAIMNKYVRELTKKVVEPPDEYNPEERIKPPIVGPSKIKIQYEVDEHIECPPYEDDAPKKSPKVAIKEELFVEEEMGEEEEYSEGDQGQGFPMTDLPDFDLNALDDAYALGGEEEEEEVIEIGPPPKKVCTRIVEMPAVWVPNDARSHAALIYVFFRAQTLPFLPPDPPPEPPYIIMAFDTYKKRDLLSLAERNKNDIPQYGFFTSDDADEARFIANSAEKYTQDKASADDKLVFKVKKATSHMMLTLATYGATYVSPNATIGKEEAMKFFPPGYKTVDDERQAALEAQQAETGKRKTLKEGAPQKGKAPAEARAKAELEAEPKAELEAEPKADLEAEPQAGLEAEALPQAEPQAEPHAEPEAQAEPQAGPEAQAEPQAGPEAQAEPQTEPQAEVQAEPETKPQAEPEAEPQPEPEAKPEPAAESTEPVVENAPKEEEIVDPGGE